MNVRKIILWSVILVFITVVCYFGIRGAIVLNNIFRGCGFDDGPFYGQIVESYDFPDSLMVIEIINGSLLIDNRADTLSPIIGLTEDNQIKWIIDMDVSKTEGFESCKLWEVSDIKITNPSNPIRFTFIGYWTYGGELGSININRKNGKNKFCLSW